MSETVLTVVAGGALLAVAGLFQVLAYRNLRRAAEISERLTCRQLRTADLVGRVLDGQGVDSGVDLGLGTHYRDLRAGEASA